MLFRSLLCTPLLISFIFPHIISSSSAVLTYPYVSIEFPSRCHTRLLKRAVMTLQTFVRQRMASQRVFLNALIDSLHRHCKGFIAGNSISYDFNLCYFFSLIWFQLIRLRIISIYLIWYDSNYFYFIYLNFILYYIICVYHLLETLWWSAFADDFSVSAILFIWVLMCIYIRNDLISIPLFWRHSSSILTFFHYFLSFQIWYCSINLLNSRYFQFF